MSSAIPAYLAIDRLNAIGVALSRERDIGLLLENILVAAKDLLHADAGTLYRVSERNGQAVLQFEIMRTDSLGLAQGGSSGHPPPAAVIPLFDANGLPNLHHIAARAVNDAVTINIHDAYCADGYDFSGTREFDARNRYHSCSFLTVPLKNHENDIIGVLQLINALDPESGRIMPFSIEQQHLAESLASQAAIALTNRQLINQLEALFEAFVGLINTAIDDKSPYTGGHCARVPVLTMMIADAAIAADEGLFAGFDMDERARYELKLAGLLHDCGKITTPVHVVDKASKLQTIFDRIELLATRFEILKRDAQIACLKGETEPQQRDRLIRQYEDDLAFLRNMNQGGEYLQPALRERIEQIAAYTWTDPSGQTCAFLSEDELANLCIARGTLNESERAIINHHIDVTIEMLEALPWPRHLRRVSEYAGGHHERMDGRGYPKGLRREQMSIPARMMGIADIFEALTAHDRPYKPAKTLSETLKIMESMKNEGHIDPDLFDLFVSKKVYLRYARQFLAPEQIDLG
jgi:HD-GYP domain-containing protein (c-di-GMP phosphodiesterase class II)